MLNLFSILKNPYKIFMRQASRLTPKQLKKDLDLLP